MKKGNIAAFLSAILLFCLLSGCGSSLEKKLPGSWNNSFHTLTFYSDGTYEESRSYGTGEWTILEGNTLKLTDFYGNTTTYTITELTDETMTVNEDWVWNRVS